MGTPGNSVGDVTFVEAHGRLHFGVLDLRGSLGRWFGGIGASAPAPMLLLSASRETAITVEGEDAARAEAFARTFLLHHGVVQGARIRIHTALPAHAGLGSGTQLALGVARALADLYALPSDPASLALAVGRARRSAIGTWAFAHGGLVVEGGRPRERASCGPLIARIEMPASWRCIVAVPHGASAISGAAEEQAFTTLPQPPQRDVERIAHLVLMALLPAAADADLATFGGALTEIQEINGRWFAPVQGDTFAPGATRDLIATMRALGAAGVGQSSWGPTVYGIADSDAAATELAERLRRQLGANGAVYHGPFPTHGARVWRTLSTSKAGRNTD
jgi:beta-ribofuranosylaminobenzene 5'-phosphate synthase